MSSRRIDNTNPTVTMGALPAWVDGTITLTSTPADGGGIASVAYQYKLTSTASWTTPTPATACSSSTSPYSCTFNTTALTNGVSYDFRVIATDNAGRTGTSGDGRDARRPHQPDGDDDLARRVPRRLGDARLDGGRHRRQRRGLGPVPVPPRRGRLDQRLLVVRDAVLVRVRHDLGGRRHLRLPGHRDRQRRPHRDLRHVTNRRIDNTDPVTATLTTTVGTNLSGNVTFNGAAADNAGGSGIASWKVQTSPTGTNTWTDLCTDAATPFGTCTGNVDGLADGNYDFRALATDMAGNTLASTVQTNRRVDTDGPVTSVTTPANGTRVSGMSR